MIYLWVLGPIQQRDHAPLALFDYPSYLLLRLRIVVKLCLIALGELLKVLNLVPKPFSKLRAGRKLLNLVIEPCSFFRNASRPKTVNKNTYAVSPFYRIVYSLDLYGHDEHLAWYQSTRDVYQKRPSCLAQRS